jgi:hypothetical protein
MLQVIENKGSHFCKMVRTCTGLKKKKDLAGVLFVFSVRMGIAWGVREELVAGPI